MKLFSSSASPYGRKVRACAAFLGLDDEIEVVDTHVAHPSEALLAANPLGRIPVLVTDDGFTVFDSPVICDYLMAIADSVPLVPASGEARWLCLRLAALGDGIMDAAIARRQAVMAGLAPHHPLVQRHAAAVTRALDQLERDTPRQIINLATIAIASALGYLDLRFADEDWRAGRPRLSLWYAVVSDHPCLKSTAPSV